MVNLSMDTADRDESEPVLEKRTPSISHQSSFVHPSSNQHRHRPSKKVTHHRHHHTSKKDNVQKNNHGQELGQIPFDIAHLDPSILKDMDSLDDIKALLNNPPPLPVGLRLPNKTMNLDWLKKVIDDFHYQETRTDVLADLPTGFEKDKSIFTTIYSVFEHKSSEVPELPACVVPATPQRSADTPAGLTWGCEPGHFCVAPNVSVPCIPGFYCPRNTAQPALCCPGFYCSLDAKEIHTCPQGFYCPVASTKPVPCNLLAYCPPGTIVVEKYGVCGLFCGFAFLLILIFAVKGHIDKKQKARYRQRLVELDQPDPMEQGDDYYKVQEKKRLDAIEKQHREAVQVTRAVLEEEQKRFGGSSMILHDPSLAVGAIGVNNNLTSVTTTGGGEGPESGGGGGGGSRMLGSSPVAGGGDHSLLMLTPSRGALGSSSSAQSFILTCAANPSTSTFLGVGGGPSTMSLAPIHRERSFDIQFQGLGLRLPTGVEIIKNVSGRLATGRTCAVMGPSGAGKTTFLSILAGKVAKTAGSIKVNGVEQTLTLWKKLIGFVPQEDVMLPELTVREILMHSARMRQPVHMTHNAKRLKVLQVIQFLGLGHIMDNQIGDVETRGISGGERKRVNIGMELVASPSILFLDEPTSGLDSATSLEVCKLLKQIARDQSLTVAAVVHSPSPHAFQQFDDLLLLGAGGRVVYFGPRDEASDYFESIGFPTPSDESPADFYIRLAAGRVDRSFAPVYEEEEEERYGSEDGYGRKMSKANDGYDDHYHHHSHRHHSADHGYWHRQPHHQHRSHHSHDETTSRKKKKRKIASTPDERIKELFAEWENHCRRKELAKNIEKHAIRESETMMTVRLSCDELIPPQATSYNAGPAVHESLSGTPATTMHVSPLPQPQHQLVHQQHPLEQQTRFPATRPNPTDIPTGYCDDGPTLEAPATATRHHPSSQPPLPSSLVQQEFDEKGWDMDPSDPRRQCGHPADYHHHGQTPVRTPSRVERDASNIAMHQPSRSPSPTFSVPISNLAGSSEIGDHDNQCLAGGPSSLAAPSLNPSSSNHDALPSQVQYSSYAPRGPSSSSYSSPASPSSSSPSSSSASSLAASRMLRRMRISIITSYADTVAWFKDVGHEWMHWMWTVKCWFTGEKDPVRETPSIGTVFWLCFQRACMQIYRSPREFLSDQSLHLACGLCVSFAVKEMTYIPRQPAEICALAPIAIQLQCAKPLNDIPYVGMFMCLGIFFAGISVGITTFGHEKAVFWRDTSAGMPTLPYYLAKVLADIPRVIVAACLYTGAFIFFFSYRQTLGSLLLTITLLYINAFVIGYCVSTIVSRSMFALVGTGMALVWALVFSGTAPHLSQVVTSPGFKNVQWLWAISGSRWGVEAFYLKEMKSRDYNELSHNHLEDTYFFEEYDAAIWNMMYISLGWHALTVILIKLLDRHKAK